jgi:hypothetical protein
MQVLYWMEGEGWAMAPQILVVDLVVECRAAAVVEATTVDAVEAR